MNTTTKAINKNMLAKWLIVLCVPLLMLLIPISELYTETIRLFMVITIFGICIMATEVLDIMVIGMLLPVLYVITGIADSAAAFGPWTNNTIWCFMGVFIITACFDRIGLLERVAYRIIIAFGGSFKAITIGILAAGVVLNFFLAGNAALPYAVIVYAICRSLDIVGTKESAVLMLCVILSTLESTQFILNPFIQISATTQTVFEMNISSAKFMIDNAVWLLWLLLLVVWAFILLRPNGKIVEERAHLLRDKYQSLGPWTTEQKKGAIIACLSLAAMFTQTYHHVAFGWILVLTAVALFLPGVNIGDKKDFNHGRYSFAVFAAACMSIGTVGASIGFGTWVHSLLMPIAAGKGPISVVGIVWFLSVVGNLIMTPAAEAAAFAQPVFEIVGTLGYSPYPALYALQAGFNQWFLPYEAAFCVYVMSFGCIELKDFIKVYGSKVLLSGIFLIAVACPYWKLLGYM